MNATKLTRLALVLLSVNIALAVGCSPVGPPTTAGASPTGKVLDGATPVGRNTDTPQPSNGSKRYSTRELALKSGYPQLMTLWEVRIVHNDVTVKPGKNVSKIV
ncbi:MAG: hypothetical protein ACUVX1_10625 [Chloroflexota bacterium]